MRRGLGRTKGTACILLLLLMAIGCSERSRTVLEVHRSHLVTPTGLAPLVVGVENRGSYLPMLVAEQGPLNIRVGVFPSNPVLLLDWAGIDHAVTLGGREAFYQLNGGEKLSVGLRLEGRAERANRRNFRLEFDMPPIWPPPPGEVQDSSVQGKLRDLFGLQQSDVHTLYLPFHVDGDPFAIDLDFSIEREKVFHLFAAPATP